MRRVIELANLVPGEINEYISIRTYVYVSQQTPGPMRDQCEAQQTQGSVGSRYPSTPCTCIRQHTSAYVSIRQHSIRQHTLSINSVHLHTSAYVSIRQHSIRQHTLSINSVSVYLHTSAYVSIRQHSIRQHTLSINSVSVYLHTSAYVSIRQHSIRQHTLSINSVYRNVTTEPIAGGFVRSALVSP
jgi:hypothetical protein